jgi:hypothetical protein
LDSMRGKGTVSWHEYVHHMSTYGAHLSGEPELRVKQLNSWALGQFGVLSTHFVLPRPSQFLINASAWLC